MADNYEDLEKEDTTVQGNAEEMQEVKGTDEGKEANEEDKGNKFVKELISWAMIFVGAFVVAYLLSNFVIVNAKVPTGSMVSTINVGDKVIGFRLSYLFSEPERGDIVM